MPHVILEGQFDLPAAHKAFAPGRGDANGWIVKLKEAYLAGNGRCILVDCTAVRSGFSQDFYLAVEHKGGAVTVRVDPYMRIERNEGTRRAILAVTRWLVGAAPGAKLSKTNLPPELEGDLAAIFATPAGGAD